MNIALFGSAFNPPTLGHADAIEWLLASQQFEAIWLIPSYKHAFAKQMLDYTTRIALVENFVADVNTSFNTDAVISCPIEHLISCDNQPVYTWDVLNYLQDRDGSQHTFSFVMGPDNKANWHKFYKSTEIAQRWNITVVPERKAIRSSLVRQAIETSNDFQHMVTPAVFEAIKAQRLYQPAIE